jgi:hypothetical protein
LTVQAPKRPNPNLPIALILFVKNTFVTFLKKFLEIHDLWWQVEIVPQLIGDVNVGKSQFSVVNKTYEGRPGSALSETAGRLR